MVRIIIALVFIVCPAYAGESDEAANKCVQTLLSAYDLTPGSGTGLGGAVGYAEGFAYSIQLNRTPDYDEDDATLKKQA